MGAEEVFTLLGLAVAFTAVCFAGFAVTAGLAWVLIRAGCGAIWVYERLRWGRATHNYAMSDDPGDLRQTFQDEAL